MIDISKEYIYQFNNNMFNFNHKEEGPVKKNVLKLAQNYYNRYQFHSKFGKIFIYDK